MDSIFETLRSLPLLNGVSPERLQSIVSSTPLHFLKYLDGQVITRPGDPMTHLIFVISGAVRVTISNSTGRFRVSQTLAAPDVVAPEFMFGRTTLCPSLVEALGDVGVVKISKADFISMMRTDEVILFNYLNYLAACSQLRVEGILSLTAGTLEERIAFWIIALTQRTGRDIVLSCSHRDLSSFFGAPRSMFIATLNDMARRGIISFTPKEVRPVSREALVKLLLNSAPD